MLSEVNNMDGKFCRLRLLDHPLRNRPLPGPNGPSVRGRMSALRTVRPQRDTTAQGPSPEEDCKGRGLQERDGESHVAWLPWTLTDGGSAVTDAKRSYRGRTEPQKHGANIEWGMRGTYQGSS